MDLLKKQSDGLNKEQVWEQFAGNGIAKDPLLKINDGKTQWKKKCDDKLKIY